ncbi:MAG: rod shape-determining protein MreC [Alkalispirochaetaceae bacterium]
MIPENESRQSLFLYGIVLLVSIILLSVSTSRFVEVPRSLGMSVVSVLQRAVGGVGDAVTNTVRSVGELGRLRGEYEALLDELERYQTLESDIEQLRAENRRLRDVLQFSQNVSVRNLPAEIIGREPGNMFASFTINRGSRDGVTVDTPVIAVQDGAQGLVGRVAQVAPSSAVVAPLFDASTYVAGRLLNSRYEGLIGGGGAGATELTMRYVDPQARNRTAYGDMVVTSGLSSIYPKGIRVGTVVGIQAFAWESSLTLTLDPVVDFGRLEYVFLLLNEDSDG